MEKVVYRKAPPPLPTHEKAAVHYMKELFHTAISRTNEAGSCMQFYWSLTCTIRSNITNMDF